MSQKNTDRRKYYMIKKIVNIFIFIILLLLLMTLFYDLYTDFLETKHTYYNNGISTPGDNFGSMTSFLLAPVITVLLIIYILIILLRCKIYNIKKLIASIILINVFYIFLTYTFKVIYNINILFPIIITTLTNYILKRQERNIEKNISIFVPFLFVIYIVIYYKLWS